MATVGSLLPHLLAAMLVAYVAAPAFFVREEWFGAPGGPEGQGS